MALQRSNNYRPLTTRFRRRRKVNYTRDEIDYVLSYLTNPTAKGIWRLEADWVFGGSLSDEIQRTIKAKIPNLRPNRKKINLDEDQIKRLLDRSERISFFLGLFCEILHRDEVSESLDDYLATGDGEDTLIFSVLDLNALAITYKPALDYFEKYIYLEDLECHVGPSTQTHIKDGSFISLVGPRQIRQSQEDDRYSYHSSYSPHRQTEKRIQFLSLNSETLERIGRFLELIKKIEHQERYAVFSPEEEILVPYVQILQTTMAELTISSSTSRLFQKMLDDYENRNYTGCISTAGLIAEECLTQIYETLYRTPAPQKLTLGALKQKISEITDEKNDKGLTHNDVVTLLKNHRQNISSAADLVDSSSKALLTYIDERYKKIESKIKSMEGIGNNSHFFPWIIKLNLENIIRFRNAVSHKSVDPIGSFEALRSIYCSFSLVMWWDNQRKTVDWKKDKKNIIEQFIQQAQTYNES